MPVKFVLAVALTVATATAAFSEPDQPLFNQASIVERSNGSRPKPLFNRQALPPYHRYTPEASCGSGSTLFGAAIFPGADGITKAAVQPVRRATVLIRTLPIKELKARVLSRFGSARWNSFETAAQSMPICTGTFFNPNVLLTAFHCFDTTYLKSEKSIIVPEVLRPTGKYGLLTPEEWATLLVVEFDFENYSETAGPVAEVARLARFSKAKDFAIARPLDRWSNDEADRPAAKSNWFAGFANRQGTPGHQPSSVRSIESNIDRIALCRVFRLYLQSQDSRGVVGRRRHE